jgi:ADP-heptose:LPS heptosyltransferase
MGIGDNIMASGFAKGAADRGKKVAFGDGQRIIWDQHSEEIFRGNPNVARPGTETAGLEWVAFHKGHRIYNRREGNNWVWNYNFRPIPGEIFFTSREKEFAHRVGKGFVIIEPNVPSHKSVAKNKQWPVERFDEVAKQLKKDGYDVLQVIYAKGHRIPTARRIFTADFRHAAALLGQAALYVGPEGGLHHASAAVGAPAVVMFGGFIPPAVTGYPGHTNLTGGAEACGSLFTCEHCKAAMDAISVEEVTWSAKEILSGRHDAAAGSVLQSAAAGSGH